MSISCDDILEDLAELCARELGADRAAALRGHAEACRPCARLVAAQAALERELSSLPGAPIGQLAAPALRGRPAPAGRLLRWAAAVAAVAVVAIGASLAADMVSDSGERPRERHTAARAPATGKRPVISKIVEISGSGVASDDGLLALTAGLEAVAMRRPAKGR